MKCSAFPKLLKRTILVLFAFALGAPLCVHLFDPAFAGWLVRDRSSEEVRLGRELYEARGCQACHGAAGRHPIFEEYPEISGQRETYTYQQIIQIRDGLRTNGASHHMRSAIQSVTDSEAQAIAAYLARQ
ncbi:c-type cytochrome [bacterium]|nr:c-type cytochrome [bacterium]